MKFLLVIAISVFLSCAACNSPEKSRQEDNKEYNSEKSYQRASDNRINNNDDEENEKNEDNNNNEDNNDNSSPGCGVSDGDHEATVDYYNPNTSHSATYTLTVEVEDCEVVTIYFPKGGWLDDSHISRVK